MRRKTWLVGWSGALILSLLPFGKATIIYEVYQVRKGDTLEGVAKRYRIQVADLKAANKSLETEALKPNQLLTIPLHKAVPPPSSASPSSKASWGKVPSSSSPSQPQVSSSRYAPSEPPTGRVQSPPRSPQARVGVLGIVRRRGAKIYRFPATRSRVVYSCTQGTQLVIVNVKQKAAWYGVLMIDGSTCWIEKTAVELTRVELVRSLSPSLQGKRANLVQAALAWLGTPYKYGGTTARGIDCSALIRIVFRQFGWNLPRTARQQYRVGQTVTWDQLLPGDRLYFSKNGQTIDHTGLYMGGGQFVHASGRRGMVAVDSLGDPTYWRIFVGAKR